MKEEKGGRGGEQEEEEEKAEERVMPRPRAFTEEEEELDDEASRRWAAKLASARNTALAAQHRRLLAQSSFAASRDEMKGSPAALGQDEVYACEHGCDFEGESYTVVGEHELTCPHKMDSGDRASISSASTTLASPSSLASAGAQSAEDSEDSCDEEVDTSRSSIGDLFIDLGWEQSDASAEAEQARRLRQQQPTPKQEMVEMMVVNASLIAAPIDSQEAFKNAQERCVGTPPSQTGPRMQLEHVCIDTSNLSPELLSEEECELDDEKQEPLQFNSSNIGNTTHGKQVPATVAAFDDLALHLDQIELHSAKKKSKAKSEALGSGPSDKQNLAALVMRL
jgi:hypothetical protein